MERREFFQAGALATAASLALPRDAGAAQVRLTPAAMDGLLRRIDEQREWMATAPMDRFFAITGAGPSADRQRSEALVRAALRSLYLVRCFRDLPEHGRAHPGMQRRIAEALPEMDHAVLGARDFLANLSAADRLDLLRTLRDQPDMLPRLGALLEQGARQAGLPESGGQLRRVIEHVDRQLRRPGAGAVIDEYVARVDRAAAQAGSLEEMVQRLRDHLGAPAFYTLQQRQAELAQSWWEQPAAPGYPGGTEVYRIGDPSATVLEQEDARKRATRFRVGAILLGVSAAPTVLGLVFIPWTIGLSSIASTPGLALIIAGAVLMGTNTKRSP